MSMLHMSLDKHKNLTQFEQYEHIAHQQLPKHTTAGSLAQQAGRTERVPLMLRPDEVEAIDEFRFAYRCSNRSDAIRQLIGFGLAKRIEHESDDGASGLGNCAPSIPPADAG